MITSGKVPSLACGSLRRIAVLTLLLLGCLAATATAQPSGGIAAGVFEIDGNLLSEDPTRVDWFSGAFGPSAGVIDPDSCKGRFQRVPNFLDAAFYRDDHWASGAVDLSTFSGNKNNDCIAAGVDPWTLTAGSGPAKSDITEAYSASYMDPATRDHWLLLAFATRTTNGDSEMDFEFNAAGLTVNGTQLSGLGPDCGRTIGDFIVSINFVGGGSLPQPMILTWNGTTYVPLDITPPPGQQPRFLVAVNNAPVPAPCGAVSPDGNLSNQYITRQFAEIAINLTKSGVDLADYCGKPQSTLGFKTRSSAGFTSALKDVKLFKFHLVPVTESTIVGPTSLCAHATTTLIGPDSATMPGPISYFWSTGETTRSITLAADDLGVGSHSVWLRVQNEFGCSDSSDVVVHVHPEPQVTVAPASVCTGQLGTLTAAVSSGTAPFTYAWSTGATTASITVAQAGQYSVTVTDAAGCQSQASGTFVVHDPIVVAVANQAVCFGEAGTFEAAITSGGTAPFTYAWSNGATTRSISVGQAGEYCVTVTDAHGCTGRACATFAVRTALQVSATDVTVCNGEKGTLQANVAGGTAPFSYSWSTGATTQSITVGAAGEYRVTVTDANGCVGQASARLTVRAALEVRLGDVASCGGASVTLRPEIRGATEPASCRWSTGATTPTIEVTRSGVYTVRVQDANGCEGAASATVTMHPLVEATMADQSICSGETATLVARVEVGTGPFQYTWSNGATGDRIRVTAAGIYSVDIIDANGCKGRAEATVTVFSKPTASVGDVEVCSGKAGTLSVTATGGTEPYTYLWSTGETSRSITRSLSGEYCVTVRDANGCETRACGKILESGTPVCEIQGPSLACLDTLSVFSFDAPDAVPATSAVMPSRQQSPGTAVAEVRSAAFPMLDSRAREPRGRTSLGGVGKVGLDLLAPTSLQIEWSVSPAENAQIISGANQPACTVRFTHLGRFVVTLKLTTSAGCSSECSKEGVIVDCDAPGCPRTVGFWGRQCVQSGSGDTKFTRSEMYRIVGCIDARSEALDLGSDGTGFDNFCTILNTDSMDQRHQAKRQFAGMLANVCVGNQGIVANNGDIIRLFERTRIYFPPFAAGTIGELIDEMDAILLELEPLNLNDGQVKGRYAEVIRVADAINNGQGIGITCTSGQPDPGIARGGERIPGVVFFKPTPNPTTGSTTIIYTTTGAAEQPVNIVVYDIGGRRVRVLERGMRKPGSGITVWDGRDDQGTQVASGVYYVRGVLGTQRYTSRVVMLRK